MPTAKPQHDDLSPAWTYYLMMGEYPPVRLPGWVRLMQIPLGELDRHVREAWAEHGARLSADAATWGFTPAGVSSRRPRGDAAHAWAERWLAAHTY